MMKQWADFYIEKLMAGQEVSFRPRGNSMEPIIRSKQLCRVIPVKGGDPYELKVGDIVLCRVNGMQYLHMIKEIRRELHFKSIYTIGNNHGRINGIASAVYGKLIEVDGKPVKAERRVALVDEMRHMSTESRLDYE